MKSNQRGRVGAVVFLSIVIGAGVLLPAILPTPTQAGKPLPPRETPTPIARRAGAGIFLHVRCLQPVAYETVLTVVQWQDGLGEWHDVDPWRGTLDEVHGDEGIKRWYVAEKDFSTGPFRWVVYNETGTLAASESFYLPSVDREVVHVTVVVGE